MQRPLYIKKQSRQEEFVRRTRLCSLATFARDAIPGCFSLVLSLRRLLLLLSLSRERERLLLLERGAATEGICSRDGP
jgi:hypothetical protein